VIGFATAYAACVAALTAFALQVWLLLTLPTMLQMAGAVI